MRHLEVEIEKLANGGAGFGRYEGKVFFVPFTAPGDLIRFRITSEKRSYAEGELIELVRPSSQRVKSQCPVFGVCGGCNWQHVEYAGQISAKQEIFTGLLWKIAKIPPDRILPFLQAPDEYSYRSRVQLKIACCGDMLNIGFYRPKSHEVVDIPGYCAIAHKNINEILNKLRLLLKGCPDFVGINQIDITRGDDEKISIVLNYSGSSVTSITKYLLKYRQSFDFAGSLFLRYQNRTNKIYGVEHLSYEIKENLLPRVPEQTIFFSNSTFSQINRAQNLRLINCVNDFAALTGCEKVLDLYCGNGNFSVPLAHNAAKVVGFEDYEPSIRDAEKNAVYNKLSNLFFYYSDSLTAVKKLVAAKETFDVIVLDPPRSGAAKVMQHIHLLRSGRVVYVSCDPATLARDLNILKQKGFEIVKSQGIDMFPQTYHMESVTLLKRL